MGGINESPAPPCGAAKLWCGAVKPPRYEAVYGGSVYDGSAYDGLGVDFTLLGGCNCRQSIRLEVSRGMINLDSHGRGAEDVD